MFSLISVGYKWYNDDIILVNVLNWYSSILKCTCWRPVMQTKANYSAVYRFRSLSIIFNEYSFNCFSSCWCWILTCVGVYFLGKDYGIGTLHYNWSMSAHVSEAFSTYTSACDSTDSEHLPFLALNRTADNSVYHPTNSRRLWGPT